MILHDDLQLLTVSMGTDLSSRRDLAFKTVLIDGDGPGAPPGSWNEIVRPATDTPGSRLRPSAARQRSRPHHPGAADKFISAAGAAPVMEHSFMGDLIVNLTCPNGQEVLLFNGNPGGGTYLGAANNNDDLTPGEGWLYCFQNTATLGTLVEEYANGNTVEAGSNPPGQAMISDTYTSEESFGGFIGSDLNGTCTLTILDDAFIDDGFIFEWNMNFNPLLYPDIVSFTPIYGPGADSTFWSGPGIVSLDPNADIAVVSPSAVGENEFTYTVTNDFGCTFDTTITITVNPGIPSPPAPRAA